jgi:hypothetical protein
LTWMSHPSLAPGLFAIRAPFATTSASQLLYYGS